MIPKFGDEVIVFCRNNGDGNTKIVERRRSGEDGEVELWRYT